MEVAALLAALAGLGYVVTQAQPSKLKVPQVPENKEEEYSNHPEAPDILPRVIPHYNMPDTDERNPHNYPGPPNDVQPLEDAGHGTSIQGAFFSNRGYANKPNGWGPGDVTNTLEPQGIYPLFGRAPPGPLYIEALESEYFKPPKSTVLQDDLRQEPMPQPDIFGDKSITGITRDYIDPYTKFHSGSGALNDLYPGSIASASGAEPGTNVTGYGFANGEKFTLRTGGFHPRRRIFRMPESQRKQLYFSIRNPSFAVGRSGSIYAQGRGELGNLELPYNSYVKEWNRPPVPNAGLTSNRMRSNPKVVLKCTSRENQYIGWAGPRGTSERAQEELRLLPITELMSKNCAPQGTYGKEVSPELHLSFGSHPFEQ